MSKNKTAYLLKQGLESQNWELVQKAIEEMKNKPKPKKSKVKPKTKTKKVVESDSADDEVSEKIIFSKNNKRKVLDRGVVQAPKKFDTFTVEKSSKKAAQNKKLSSGIKERREPYKPVMIKCTNCGTKFDFLKEYPMGVLSENSNKLCNACKIK